LLQRYSENLIGKDGGARALYELGTLLQAMGLVEVQPQARKKNNDEADQYFHLLIQKYPKSIFSVRAQANLRRLESSQP